MLSIFPEFSEVIEPADLTQELIFIVDRSASMLTALSAVKNVLQVNLFICTPITSLTVYSFLFTTISTVC